MEGREFVIARVHDGKAELLKDLDDDPATITFETTEFSTYAILYRDPGSTDNPNTPDNPSKPGGSDDSPQTGDNSRLDLWLTVMSVSAAGLFLVLLCSRKKKKAE